MPYRNRVMPTGEIVHDPAYRGAFMGNRGILHDRDGTLTHRRWATRGWVTCALGFKGRRRHPLNRPGRYTELFFFDEAVAFAAGHRPCAECRRADFLMFRDAAGIDGKIGDLDARLHAQRARPYVFAQRRHDCDIADLPTGAFMRSDEGAAQLVLEDALVPFTAKGYGPRLRRPRHGRVQALTPPLLQAVLHAGYPLQINLPD